MDRCDGDGCGQPFTVEHALSCKKGGQVVARHDDLKDEWENLCGHALGHSKVFDEPLVKTSQDVREAGETDPDDKPLVRDLRGDVAAHNFWKKGQAVIFDICVTDTDCRSQRHTSPHLCLLSHERRKKRKYVDLCTARKHSFTPLAFSVDGLMGDETIAASR